MRLKTVCFRVFLLAIPFFLAGETPLPASPPVRLKVAVISDFHEEYGSTHYRGTVQKAVQQVIGWKPDLVLSTGDMVAGEKRGLTETQIRAMWKAFHQNVSDPLESAGIPFAVTPGNHDASGYPAFDLDRRIYAEEWKTRGARLQMIDGSRYPFEYAFSQGSALFLSIYATKVGALDPEQHDWIQRTIQANPQFKVRILFGHVPIYPLAVNREHEIIGDPRFEALLNSLGVTAYISGHHHTYYPGKRGSLRLIGTSCLGGGVRKYIGTQQVGSRNIVFMEIDADGIASLEAFEGPELDQRVLRSSLPEYIALKPAFRVDRDDL